MKLILTGGGIGEKAKTAFSFFSEQVKGGKVVYIPFAEEEMTIEENFVWFQEQMKPYGVFDIEIVKTEEELTKQKIDEAAGLFIGGGNAFVLLKRLKEGKLIGLIKRAIMKNKVVLGLSAGATIFGKDINSCLYDELKIIANDKNKVELEDTQGFEIFEGYSFFVHYKLAEKQLEATEKKVNKILEQGLNVIAIPEESCVYVTESEVIAMGEKPVEVITKETRQEFKNREKINMAVNKNFKSEDLKEVLCFAQAQIDDLDEIMSLYKDVIKNTFTTWDENYPSRQLIQEDILSGNIYVMKHQGEIVSTSFLGKNENDDSWNIPLSLPMSVARICVSPSYQGFGIGKRFLQCLIEEAKAKGLDGMHFHVCTKNNTAMNMYEGCGFKNYGLGKSNYGFDYYKYEQRF